MIMENRFREMNAYLGRLETRSGNGKGNGAAKASWTSQSVVGERAPAWAKSLSVSQRVLVVLIDNGGIDLRIPEVVDAIIDIIPGSSLLPDSVRQTIREAVKSEIGAVLKRKTRELLEGVELLANRYSEAKGELYGDVVILQNGKATYEALKRQLIASSKAGQLVDLFILTHGRANLIAANGDIDDTKIRAMRTEYGKPLSLRSVYMMNCVGSSLNKAWLDAGAKTSSGTKGDNMLPEPTMFFFWNNWKAGQSFETAVKKAYLETVDLLNRVVSQIGIPGLDVRSFQFVKDSEPQVEGQSSVTVSTDNLDFSQSLAVVRAFDNTTKPVGATSLSAHGSEFIKSFEGFYAKMYNDPAGHCTIGYGTLIHEGNCDGRASEQPYVKGVTKEQATQLMEQEVANAAPAILSAASKPLTQNQFDALASFVYNLGVARFHSSTLAKRLAKGRYDDVPTEIKRWTKAHVDGKVVDLPGLVRRRNSEAQLWNTPDAPQSQSLTVSCFGVALSEEKDAKWNRIAQKVFGNTDYDDYVANALTSTTFLGQKIDNVGAELIAKLQTAEATLKAKGITKAPTANSGFRRQAGMHGWGLAVDFAVRQDPYVLNEAGEKALDKDLVVAYDHIADFVLGASSSVLRNLTKGRKAFGGTIAGVYDGLRAESDAMKKYFALMKDPTALAAFLSNEWAAAHGGKPAPAITDVRQQMQDDYETLGGATTSGKKKPTGMKGVDRPFAPNSSGGAGDPATGFLNFDKDFVLALTDAGLSWGAIDMGGASGDIMHFDCRLDGKGKQAYTMLLSG
jgi:GH24 family phage-related lysozyme (muramidase)